jgi:hypothetical protein
LRQNCYFLQFFSLAFYSLIANWWPKGFQVWVSVSTAYKFTYQL